MICSKSFALLGLLLCGGTTAVAADWATSAAQCPGTRLDAPGKPLATMKITDQNPYGICFAFAATQLVDAWRYSHGNQPPTGGYGRMTSPFPPAMKLATESNNYKNFNGGFAEDAIANIVEHGSCDHRAVFQGIAGGKGNWEQKYVTALQKGFDQMTAFYADKTRLKQLTAEAKKKKKNIASYVLYEHGSAPIAQDLVCMMIEANIPQKLVDDTMRILPHLLVEETTPVSFYDRFFSAMCKDNTLKPVFDGKPPVVKSDTYGPGDGLSQAALLHKRLLLPNAQPVAISYCAEVLTTTNRTLAAVITDKAGAVTCRADPSNPKSRDTNHASIVIGQRWNTQTNKCQFLVRNSWGEGCAGYAWKPAKTATNNPPFPGCENGQIWLDEDSLGRNTYGTSYLD